MKRVNRFTPRNLVSHRFIMSSPLPESNPIPTAVRGDKDQYCFSLFIFWRIKMPQSITQRVRELRKNQTPGENMLWQCLRNHKLAGYKFRRQHPIKVVHDGEIRYFIADFYCHEKQLVIELDGKIHENQKEYDEYRTYVINQLGIRGFRIKNEELVDISSVIAKLKAVL